MPASKVQSASNTSVIASVAATFPQTPQAGNLLVAAVTSNVAVGSMAISGWSTGTSVAVGVAGGLIIFYKVSAGNETTVTATGTLATFMDLHIFEYDGIDNASPLDKTSTTADSGSGVTTLSSGTTATLTQANELAFAAIATAGTNGGNVSWSNSYAAEITTTDLQTADLITAATTATSSTAVWNTSQRAAGAIVTFFGETGDSYGPKISLKPRVPTINWNHPLTKGLVFDEPYFEGGGSPKELITNSLGNFNSDVSWTKDIYGGVANFGGSTGKESRVTSGLQNNTNQVTVQVIYLSVNITSGGNFPRIVQKGNQTIGYFEISLDSTINIINFVSRYSTSNVLVKIAVPSNNIWHNCIATYDGSLNASGINIFIDGVLQSPSGTQDGIGTRTADSTDFSIGNRQLDTARAFTGKIALVRYWNRVLNAQEIKQLYTNPWQIYKQPDLLKSK